jgi:hypothetical protein
MIRGSAINDESEAPTILLEFAARVRTIGF